MDTIIEMMNGEPVEKVGMIPRIVIDTNSVKDYYTP